MGDESLSSRLDRLRTKAAVNGRDFEVHDAGHERPTGRSPVKPKRPAKAATISDVRRDIDRDARRWLWKDRLPKSLFLVSAREGTGKSALVNWLATTISRGDDWPDNQPGEPGDVLVLDSEDGPHERLIAIEASGGNMDRVAVAGEDHLLDSGRTLAGFIEDYAESHPGLKLVAIDVGRDFDRRLRSGEDSAIESGLAELKSLAVRLGVTIVLVHHEAKGSEERSPRDRARGSTHWTSHARGHWSLSAGYSYGPDAVAVETGKANWTKMRDPMIFRFETVATEDGFTFGKLVFDQTVALADFRPSADGQPRGRKKAADPKEITRCIIDVLLAAGGSMPGRMPAELKGEEKARPGGEIWNSYAANLVATRLAIAPSTVATHWRECLDDQIVDGHWFSSDKEKKFNGRWLWCVRVQPVAEGENS